MPENFKFRVLKFVRAIAKGKVVSYGQVAAACGNPKAARQVGAVLKGVDLESGIPWWRVINSRGLISIKGNWTATRQLQKKLLEQEGVRVTENFLVDIKKYKK